MEKRILIAFVLSAVIFVVWSVLFPPPPPVKAPDTDTARPVEGERAATGEPAAEPEGSGARPETEEREEPPEDVVREVVEGTGEQDVILENEDVILRLSNRGAAVHSIVLKGYQDDAGQELEIVQSVPLDERSYPLQLVRDGVPDSRLYAVEESGRRVRFRWADGQGAGVDKTVELAERGYEISVAVDVTGAERSGLLSVGTGMRDTSQAERENRFATWGHVTVAADDDRERVKREKLKEPRVFEVQRVDYVGFEDTYFLNVWRPRTAVTEVAVKPLKFTEVGEGTEPEEVAVLQVNLGAPEGEWRGTLFAAPKEYDLLRSKGGALADALDFGIFHPISVFFLKILRWIHQYVQNWGVAIILLTIALRIVLFPLMHTSTVSMRKMQKVQPKAKAIQEKYKKNKSDPQVRQRMNQEVMALYKSEGVNPMAGCLPILVQMPILLALYTLFAHAIELRHAPFMWWIQDLSAKDPIYVTPVLMTATMWLQQRLAPQAGDPQQQRIMRLMPLIFGVMFLGFPSGLVLYWLTNNVVSIFQQEVTLHLIGERKRGGGDSKGRKKK